MPKTLSQLRTADGYNYAEISAPLYWIDQTYSNAMPTIRKIIDPKITICGPDDQPRVFFAAANTAVKPEDLYYRESRACRAVRDLLVAEAAKYESLAMDTERKES